MACSKHSIEADVIGQIKVIHASKESETCSPQTPLLACADSSIAGLVTDTDRRMRATPLQQIQRRFPDRPFSHALTTAPKETMVNEADDFFKRSSKRKDTCHLPAQPIAALKLMTLRRKRLDGNSCSSSVD